MKRILLWKVVVLCTGCSGAAIVGLECREGLAACGDECVDLLTDPENCGACGNSCAQGESCAMGLCTADEGSEPTTTLDGSGLRPIDTGDGGGGGGGGGNGCAVGRTECAEECVDLDSDPENCGGCGNECGGSEVCSEGVCTGACGEGLTLCGRACVDLEFDADHCGACNAYCETGICELGVCLGGAVGHVVLVGHDYGRGRTNQNRIVGNAVFIAGGSTVSVLAYVEDSDEDEVDNVYAAIDQVGEDLGRSHTVFAYDPASTLRSSLAEVDVLLVVDQEGVSGDALETLGASFAEDLDRFLRRGGVVVVTDGAQTHRLVVGAGLVEIAGATEVTGETLSVAAPADAVAAGLSTRYRGEDASIAYDTSSDGAVVTAEAGAVVIHEVVLP